MTAPSALTAREEEQTFTIIDEDHLERMTLGDCSLEREVLEIFARQIMLMLPRITAADRAQAAAAAHTLKGSARGLGAWRVARAAERLEQVAGGAGDFNAAIAQLKAASAEVRAAIGARLGVRLDSPDAGISGYHGP